MVRLIGDYETDGLFPDQLRPGSADTRRITRVHCLVLQDIDTGEVGRYHEDPALPREGTLREGVAKLLAADLRAGHNWNGYDERVTREFFPDLYAARRPDAQVWDTQVGAEVVWPYEWLKGNDATRAKRRLADMPKKLIGSHSLEAWGFRMGNLKGGYEGDFQTFTPEMLAYCVQDVAVTRDLFLKLERRIAAGLFSWRAWSLEQAWKPIVEGVQRDGVAFDMPAAEALTAKLQARRAELRDELAKVFKPFSDLIPTDPKVLENARARVALWKGRGKADQTEKAEVALAIRLEGKVKVTPFNPGSRHHIARALQERGWKVPKRGGYTPEGQVKIDETVLERLKHYDGVPTLIEHFVVDKRLSQLAEPAKKDAVPWMKLAGEDGRIHGRIRHNGAITNRCTHSRPNLTAVPRATSPYGPECRALFVAKPGYLLVGGDLKGIQLRGLGHFLAPIDGGAFIEEVLHGDPHDANRRRMGMPEGKLYRDQAKTTIYAVFFGAGPGKVMQIQGCTYKRAKEVLELLLENFPALAAFKRKTAALHLKRGTLNGPDGRHAFTRSAHSSIATALQLFEAVVMKQAVVILMDRIESEGLDSRPVLLTHDEAQLETLAAHAPRVAELFLESVREAGRVLESRCPLEGDVKVGKNWSETH